MLLRHDRLVAQTWWKPFKPEYKHELFSASKSFTSVAIGIAQSEGYFKLDDKLVSFFPEKMTEKVSERMRQVTLRNLLTMASGHESCPLLRLHPQKDWVQGFLESELVYDPGTRFVYNSAATYMLAAVLRKTTGQNVIDFLQERLFLPLGIRAEKWDSCPMGTNIGGWGFWLKTEDLLRFGRLLLNNGNWNGKQLIPADYVKEATRFQIDNSTNEQPDWKLGYG
jgi:CubicO group peptidase (beta-lactamase class C family)